MFYYYLQKIIEYGLYLLIFLLPVQTRWIIKAGELNGKYWEYGTISLYATDALLIILLLLFIVLHFKTKKQETGNGKLEHTREQQISKVWFLVAGLELMVFISMFFASDKLVAVYSYGRFLLGIGLFWLVVSASYNKLKLIGSLLAGIVLQAILGIWQFLTQSGFACKWLGMAMHQAADLGTSVVETLNGQRWLRAYGGMDHPNILGGALAVGVLLAAGLIIKNYKNKKTFSRLFLLSVICCLLSALFFTFSRGAWLGLIVGISVALFALVARKRLLQQKRLLEIILVAGVLLFILFNQLSDLVVTRLSDDARLEVKSKVERIESYKGAQELIKDHWLFGAGIGNYTLGINNDMPGRYYQSAAPKFQPGEPAHNVFLLVWAEIGIFGLLFFISLLLITYYLLLKNFKKWQNLSIDKIALLTAILIMLLIDHWWWSLHFGILFFWLLIGIILRPEIVKMD